MRRLLAASWWEPASGSDLGLLPKVPNPTDPIQTSVPVSSKAPWLRTDPKTTAPHTNWGIQREARPTECHTGSRMQPGVTRPQVSADPGRREHAHTSRRWGQKNMVGPGKGRRETSAEAGGAQGRRRTGQNGGQEVLGTEPACPGARTRQTETRKRRRAGTETT